MGALRLRRPDADLFVPDGAPLEEALARTTDLGVGAHPDDLELSCVVAIGECSGRADRWFTGVTCTNGSGSVRGGRFAAMSDDEIVQVRREEQRTAAEVGGYSAVLQLMHPSAEVKEGDGFAGLVDELTSVLEATRPVNVYTHNPADAHRTHVAVAAATLHAVRRLPPSDRPQRVAGVEGWRDLDWLGDGEKLRFDATPHADLAMRLAAVHASQIEGAKRYDLAWQGRRRANATFAEARQRDTAEEVVVAVDLTPLVRNDDLDLLAYVRSAIRRFEQDVERTLEPYAHVAVPERGSDAR